MSMEILRDRSGSVIGRIIKMGNQFVLYTPGGERLGHYDPNMNATYDARSNRIGQGNLLALLLA